MRLNIGDTAHSGALELSSIKLIDGSFQISCSLELNEPSSLFAASLRIDNVQTRLTCKIFQVLPACFRETRNQHAKNRTTGTRHVRAIRGAREIFFAAWSTRKLDCKSLAFEVATVECRNHISSIHRILVLDKPESVHQLDLCDLPGAMATKVFLDVLFSHLKKATTTPTRAPSAKVS
jgi:hypothetical protein